MWRCFHGDVYLINAGAIFPLDETGVFEDTDCATALCIAFVC